MQIKKAQWHHCAHVCFYVSIRSIRIFNFTIKTLVVFQPEPDTCKYHCHCTVINLLLRTEIIFVKEGAHDAHTLLLSIILNILTCFGKTDRTLPARIPELVRYSLPAFSL